MLRKVLLLLVLRRKAKKKTIGTGGPSAGPGLKIAKSKGKGKRKVGGCGKGTCFNCGEKGH